MISKSFVRPLLIILAIAVAIVGLAFMTANSYYQLVLALVPIWATLGLSWNILSGYTGLMSFGHAAFFGLGSYTVALLTIHLGVTPWIGIPAGGAVGAIAGLAIGYPTFRLRGHYFALAMLAYPTLFLYLFDWLGYQEVALPRREDHPLLFMQFDHRVFALMSVALMTAALIICLIVERSRFGLSMVAIKQNEFAAEASGIDSFRWKMRAIVLSGALAGLAGGLYAVVLIVITPASVFGLLVSAQALIVTLFGGVGTLWGPIIGTVTLIPLTETLRAELGSILPGIQGIIYGCAIILVILLAPEGVYWRLHDFFASRRRAANSVPVLRAEPAAGCVVALNPIRARAAGRSPADADKGPILHVRGLSKSFGGLAAVQKVDFQVERGSIVGILGPNGAGKTTLFNLLNGFVHADAGSARFENNELIGLKPNKICRFGIGRTFQVARPFPRLSVLENVMVGALVATTDEAALVPRARAALQRVGMEGRADAPANRLTAKEMRLMELARALAGGPRLLLLDETLAGLGREEVGELVAVIRSLVDNGLSIVIIEHTMHAMIQLADRFVVLDHGQVIAGGAPHAVMKDPAVVEAYLGRRWMDAHAAS
jgi:branched-chain amino acid transport system permease protein